MAKTSKPRKKSPTAGRKTKPWRDRARLDLLPLEPAVEKLRIQRAPLEVIAAWVRSQAKYGEVTDEQVAALVEAIERKWAAVMEDPRLVEQAKAEHLAMIDAALHDAWNRPVFIMTPEGMVPAKNPDGTLAVQADHKAIPAYLKERRELLGFSAPQKHAHVHLHGNLPPPAALSPADREAEIRELMERRARALAGAAPALPPGVPPGSRIIEATPAPAKKKSG